MEIINENNCDISKNSRNSVNNNSENFNIKDKNQITNDINNSNNNFNMIEEPNKSTGNLEIFNFNTNSKLLNIINNNSFLEEDDNVKLAINSTNKINSNKSSNLYNKNDKSSKINSQRKNARNLNNVTARSNKSFKSSFIAVNWRDINITSLIGENKLLNASPSKKLILLFLDQILFQGELKKLINTQITVSANQQYSSKFCVLTKSEFLYFKSKEQFISLLNPLFTTEIFKIKEIERFYLESNFNKNVKKKYFHFFVKIVYYIENVQDSLSKINNNFEDDLSK